MIKAKELAALINGREHGSEVDDHEAEEAKRNLLLVVHGYSDANMELRGFVDDEVPCYDGGSCEVTRDGLREQWDDCDEKNKEDARKYFAAESLPKIKIDAIWAPNGDSGPSWLFETTAKESHPFEIMEDGEVYCRGLVIDCQELFP